MPVPTETSWNVRRLNLAFAVAAVLLLASVVGLVLVDHAKPWRGYQRQGRVWNVAMVRDAAVAASEASQRAGLAELQRQMRDLRAQLDHPRLAELEAELAQLESDAEKLRLPTAAAKGELDPLAQQIERAALAHGADSPQVRELRVRFSSEQRRHAELATRLATLDGLIAERREQIAQQRDALARAQRRIDDLTRQEAALQERLAALQPRGVGPRVADVIRNAPLLDWLNPSEQVQQVVVPQVRTDLNFLTVETIDRCQTCHVNIADPAFEPNNLLLFVERQIAQLEGQDVSNLTHPVVLLDFWERVVDQLELHERRAGARRELLESLNRLRRQAGLEGLADDAALPAELEQIASRQSATPVGDGVAITRGQWVEPIAWYLQDLRLMARDRLGDEQFKLLTDQYRHAAVERYNDLRGGRNLPALSANGVLLGHPRMDLYVHADATHPMSSMGCTVCHEGAGQETLFEHTGHTPREIWVDAVSGAPVPDALVTRVGESTELRRLLAMARAGRMPTDATPDAADGHATHSHEDPDDTAAAVVYAHDEVNLNNPGHGAPFAPAHEPDGDAAVYTSPARPDRPRLAVRQADHWSKTYGWHAIHFMHWEKPMHAMQYIESSCNKCHTEIFDLKETAPRLFEGRRLFADMGCVNCHAVTDLEDDLDIRKIGPSLAHLPDKLSPQMVASWIWSPKAFRPLAKMPHYFMLENNSSPTDLLRTRTEVAAMTHYLMTAEPAASSAATSAVSYQPEAIPAELVDAGDARRGRALFNSLGCLACHTNLVEQGREWIVEDLVARAGLDAQAAAAQYEAMSLNQRQWYALEHLPHRIERTGPELSAVGTKLLTGRTEPQARGWLYDWLRNPRHYDDTTIMPSLRLSPEEAVHIAAYLLTQRREDWQPGDFTLSHDGERMLEELVVNLQAGQSTPELARRQIADWPIEQRMTFLGRRMISHYGCSGCHTINGFEQAVSACTNLDDWGVKDPHKLDFGYFDHAFDAHRQHPLAVWKVEHEGLEAHAPRIEPDGSATRKVLLAWEHMDLERRPFLYHKLHNPRLYDRGRFPQLDEAAAPADVTDARPLDVGRPYDKLKMPKFFLTDEQVRALVTYVTAIRRPLVDPALQVRDEATLRVARGRQLAGVYNCFGCHNIEGNAVHIQQFYDVLNADGTYNYDKLNTAPPRLVGQGAKTQPQWLMHFLHNVHPIRPWLQVRMPSFAFDQGDVTHLVDYFAGWGHDQASALGAAVAAVREKIAQAPDSLWFENEGLAVELERLKAFALHFDLAKAWEFSSRRVTEQERRQAWLRVLKDAEFLADLYDAPYPFPHQPPLKLTDEQFARGEALFTELRCIQCHILGDEQTLIDLWKLDHADGAASSSQGNGADDDPYAEDDPYDDGQADDAYGYDDDGYGEDGYGEAEEAEPAAPLGVDELGIMVYRHSAPNLNLVSRRLQWDWVAAWLQEPATIQPGTAMPQWFPAGHSAFANYPESYRRQVEAMYGIEGRDQIALLLGYLWAVGDRNYTPGAERLHGIEKQPVTLAPLVEAPAPPSEPAAADDGAAPQAAEPAEPASSATGDVVDEPPTDAPAPAAEPLQEQAAVPYEGDPVEGQSTRVVGRVFLDGPPPARRPIRMEADQYCVRQHTQRPMSEAMVVSGDGGVANVLVHVVEGLPDQSWSAPGAAAELDQHGCVYVPHILAMQAGQPLRILNSDNTLHNVKMASGRNGAFNESMPVRGMVLEKRLERPELGVSLKCDVHPWMGAYLHVLAHPFFAVTDAAGRYEIRGLPPGRYVLETWHESGRVPPQRVTVDVQQATSHRTDVRLASQ